MKMSEEEPSGSCEGRVHSFLLEKKENKNGRGRGNLGDEVVDRVAQGLVHDH